MKGNIGQLMKQAQQMQENMRRMQESLAAQEVEGQSGAGMVKIQMTCKYEVKRVAIDPSLLGDDKEMLEDLVVAAFNDATLPTIGIDKTRSQWRRTFWLTPAPSAPTTYACG